MKGIILAGGTGSRLYPVTKAINKHLLPVGKYPMIFYSVDKLRQAGITRILVVTNAMGARQIINLLGSGEAYGIDLTYKIQDQAGGIADALRAAEDFVRGDSSLVLLGDNIFEEDLSAYVAEFKAWPDGARVFLKEVSDPSGYGVALVDPATGRVTQLVEKPPQPISNLCVTGIYLYDATVFEIIRTLKPSKRGELEITDVNNVYLQKDALKASVLNGWWIDAGTHESITVAAGLAKGYRINWAD